MESVKCAVCGKTINPNETQYKLMYEGEIYYFCCSHCMSKFSENPEKYVTLKERNHHDSHIHKHHRGCGS